MKDRPLVIVDIQPAYLKYAENDIDMSFFAETLNTLTAPIYYIFVGTDLECDEEFEVINMLREFGVDDDKINAMEFIEKDYGWIREAMEQSEEAIENKFKSGEANYALDLFTDIPKKVNICGGGRYECLAEVQHTFDFMKIDYETIESFVY